MNRPRSAPPMLLYLGLACVVVALALGGYALYQGSSSARPEPEPEHSRNPLGIVKRTIQRPSRTASDSSAVALDTSTVPVSQPVPAEVVEARMSRAEERAQARAMLLARVAQTPAQLDPGWFAETFQFVPDEPALQTFYDSLLVLGERLTVERETRLKQAKQRISREPKDFLALARSGLYAMPPDSAQLVDQARGNLAVALFLELKLSDTLADAKESLLNALFKGLDLTYQGLAKLAIAAEQDPRPWVDERARVLEAAALDRYLRLTRLRPPQEQATGPEGGSRHRRSEAAAPPVPTSAELAMAKSLDKYLAQLGRLYAESTRAESEPGASAANARRAVAVLSMLYRRTNSPTALGSLLGVERVQRAWLYRLAREHWRRAQIAAAQGNATLAAEQYGLAWTCYENYLVTAGKAECVGVIGEQQSLEQEVEAFRARFSGGAATPPGSPKSPGT